jgi:hypothetical protein
VVRLFNTKEHRKKNSEAVRKAMARPEVREKRSRAMKAIMTPEFRARISKATRRAMARPEVKRRMAIGNAKEETKHKRRKNGKHQRAIESKWNAKKRVDAWRLAVGVGTKKFSKRMSEMARLGWPEKDTRAYKAKIEKDRQAVIKAYQDPAVRKRVSEGTKKALQDPKVRRNHDLGRAKARRMFSKGRESKPEYRLREAFNLPHHDIIKFGRAWDGAWAPKKTFLEIQGCWDHRCKKCGNEDDIGKHERDLAKRKIAEKHGWRVLYIWSHEEKSVLVNP